mmetsp:Transcript_6462/g.18005  ORF Transcript_6462/g.18005 Transcript_6462/m.18005 type:complete len:256 (+) Transcript_6462:751-1518(+)
MELPQLVLEVHDGLELEDAFHDVRQRHGEGNAAVAHGAHNPLRVRVLELDGQGLLLAFGGLLQLLEIGEHRPDGLAEHALDLGFHEGGEVAEADRAHVLFAEAPSLHLAPVLLVHVLGKLAERLWGSLAILPEGEGQREAHQVLRQVTEAVDPLVHVVWRQVLVVLVQLVSDQHCAFELRIEVPAPRQGGHGRGVASLLHTKDDVARVPHEFHVELVDLVPQFLPLRVQGEVAEARQVDDLHVDAAGRLDAHIDG